MTKKDYIVLAVFILLLVWVFVPKKTKVKKEAFLEESVEVIVKEDELPRRRLVPDRPEDYGMIVIDEKKKPISQADWDRFLGGKIEEIKLQTSPEIWAKVEGAIKESPEKTKAKIEDIDKRIEEAKQILKEKPTDDRSRQRIERLMILKTIGKQLGR